MKRYVYIDFLKTITLFSVIVGHCSLFFSANPFWLIKAEQESILLRWFSNLILVSAVPIFVFSSGFVFQICLQNNKSNPNWVELIKNKTVRLLIPYFIYGVLYLVPLWTLFDIPSFGRERGTSLIDGYKAMLMGQFSEVAWFLLLLFWVTLIWILLNRLLRKRYIFYGAIVSVLLYFAAHFFLAEISYYKLSQIDIYIVCFFVGAAFSYISDFIYNKVTKWILILGSLLGIIGCLFLSQLSTELYIVECALRIATPILFLTFSMGLCHTKMVEKIERTATYNWLRKNSFYLYLFQVPGIYIIFELIYPLIGTNPLLCTFVLFILTTLCDVISTLIYVFIKEKILHLLYKIKA